MARLVCQGLAKTFAGGVRAVRGLSLEVADHEFVFLLGPSGAGKTTTLRLVAGLERPDAGRVLIGERDLTEAPPRERQVAMVYDKNSLYPHLPVFENMAYPLRLQRMDEPSIRKRVREVSEVLRIEDLMSRYPRELSGGQQQRVAIGRMLVRRPDVFLMDEPISHLDAKLRAHMRLEFKRLQREYAATILYVSHDQLEAMTMGDRIAVIDRGTLQQVGPPREVFDRPANRFVAGFVGEPSMNITDCELEQSGAETLLRVGGQSIRMERSWLQGAVPDRLDPRGLTLGVRPQHLALAAATPADGSSVLTGKVYAVETLGSETIVDVELEGRVFRAWAKTRGLAPGLGHIGAPVGLRVDPATIYLFDRRTGRTLAQAELGRMRQHQAA
jgi:multiple sugar transport system ATP-binding protein